MTKQEGAIRVDIHVPITRLIIISLAVSLNLTVVAEGVENEVQRNFLIKHGCLVGQGHFFSRPLPAEEIPPLLSGSTVLN
jgi:EAL domain-containing protein (putative c-di-GMP-specific phosphodiesterase class I)